MYRVVINDKEKMVSSVKELEKCLRRGKIDDTTEVTDMDFRITKTAREFIEKPLFIDTSAGSSSEQEADDVLKQMIDFITAHQAKTVALPELEKLRHYKKLLKEQDMLGLVDWEKAILFRKALRRLEARMALEKVRIAEQVASEAKKQALPEGQKTKPAGAKAIWTKFGKVERQRTQPVLTAGKPPPDEPPSPDGMPRPARTKGVNFWHSSLVIMLTLVFFPPLGLLLLWTSPRDGFFGNIFLRLAITIPIVWGAYEKMGDETFLQNISKLKSLPQALHPMEFGKSYSDQPKPALTGVSDRFPSGAQVHFIVKQVTCQKPPLKLVIDRLEGSQVTTIRSDVIDRPAAQDIFKDDFIFEAAGRFRVTLFCGPDEYAQGEIEIVPPEI